MLVPEVSYLIPAVPVGVSERSFPEMKPEVVVWIGGVFLLGAIALPLFDFAFSLIRAKSNVGAFLGVMASVVTAACLWLFLFWCLTTLVDPTVRHTTVRFSLLSLGLGVLVSVLVSRLLTRRSK